MKAIIAIDSFKGSMDSLEAGMAAAEGLRAAYPEAETLVYPLADGGEGTVQALVKGLGGTVERTLVTGPLGEKVVCEYGILTGDASSSDGATAIIEMAGAAGITLLKPEQRNPLYTTTYGVGEVIKDAIAKGCRKFIVGIGGSATNDCGIGMLQALGAEFLDEGGKQVPFGAAGVEKIAFIDTNKMLPELDGCQFRIACDVDNPLYGEKGCSHIFGPQKGATPEMVEEMDGWIKRFAGLTAEHFAQSDNSLSKSNQNALMKTGSGIFKFQNPNCDNQIYDNSPTNCDTYFEENQNQTRSKSSQPAFSSPDYPGCGAAGGLGFGFRAFLHGQLEPGISIVLEEIKIEKAIQEGDIVITGEGRLDGQTVMGKAPIGVAKLAKKYGKPVLAFAGSVTEEADACNAAGIDAFFPILRQVATLEEAMDPETARRNMKKTVEQVFRVISRFSIDL